MDRKTIKSIDGMLLAETTDIELKESLEATKPKSWDNDLTHFYSDPQYFIVTLKN